MRIWKFHLKFLLISVGLLGMSGNSNAVVVNLGTPIVPFEGFWDSVLAPLSSDYLLIGNGPVGDFGGQPGVGNAVNMNNYELGANKAPVPSPSGFGDDDSPVDSRATSSSLLGNVPDIPPTAQAVFVGIGGHGNIAITSGDGEFNLQNVGVYADPSIGIRCAKGALACNDQSSDSFFNDPNEFPNTLPVGDSIQVDATTVADQSTRIDPSNNAGVTGGFNFTALKNEVFNGEGAFAATIPGLAATGTMILDDGVIQESDPATLNFIDPYSLGSFIRTDATKDGDPFEKATYTLSLGVGLHVIDIILTTGTEFVLNTVNFVVDALDPDLPTYALFRLTDKMSISNSNVLAGNNIKLHNIMFFSTKDDDSEHFNFNNTIINGASFWSTAQAGGEININNAQGCTQLVADKINLNDVRFTRCEWEPTSRVPEPSSMAILAAGLVGLALARRRRQKAA